MRIKKRKKYMDMNTYGGLAVISLIILGIVSWMVYAEFSPFLTLEDAIQSFFQRTFGNPSMTYSDGIGNSLLTFLATYGSASYLSMATVLIAIYLFVKRQPVAAVWFLGVVSTGGIFGILLKNILQRTRPISHLPFDSGFAFPSGHAIASTLFFLSILLVFLPKIQKDLIRTPLAILIYFVWAGILFSRLYFHAHRLGDLVAGVSFGIFWVTIASFVYNWVVRWLTRPF